MLIEQLYDICQRKLVNDPRWIHFIPGVKLNESNDALGQQYITSDIAISQRGCDVILVGRGITQAKDPLAEAVRYREAGMRALQGKHYANER
ncbi:MAG: orotidine 5'-phosphate decarboxylase / HUMPS family protein [Waddliaceae bacterium]